MRNISGFENKVQQKQASTGLTPKTVWHRRNMHNNDKAEPRDRKKHSLVRVAQIYG